MQLNGLLHRTKISLRAHRNVFLFINLGEAKEKRFQVVEPEGRVLESSGASLRYIKKRFRASEK